MTRRATTQHVYESLHGRIVRGDARPGDLLSETKVAESFGLSRTPVREVFWRLGEAGFVRVIPQVGTFVAPINISGVYNSQFIRETLECRAIADAAERAGPGDLETLGVILDAQDLAMEQRDFSAFFVLDETMHRTLMEMSGRPFVWQVIAGAKAQLDRVRFLSLEEDEWPSIIMAQHRAIVGALAEHDAALAVREMTAHLRTAFAAVDRIATMHPNFFEGQPAG